jgi:ubiquinone/menaquinone biosynthesis C-methylase UbiE
MSSGEKLSEKKLHERVFELKETVKSWDDDYYHPISLRLYDWMIEDMLGFLRAGKDSEVLDAGCGPGVHAIRAARLGCRVRAVDLSYTMLESARERAVSANVADRIVFEQGDLTALKLPDASFEHAFSWGVVIHIPPPGAEAALRNLCRVVKRGGHLALYLVNRSAIDHKLESLARWVTGKKLQRQNESLGRGVFYSLHDEKLWLWHFDDDLLTRFMQREGLQPVKRVGGEFSEVQRRVPAWIRPLFLWLNNLAYKLRLPASLYYTNLWVFRKT